MTDKTTVFAQFERTKEDGKLIKFKIQDVRQCDVEKVIEYISKWYIYEENFVRNSGVPNSKESTEEFLGVMHGLMTKGDGYCLVCCLDDGDDDNIQIVGTNILYHMKKSDPELNYDLKTDGAKNLFKLFNVLHDVYDEMEKLNIEEFVGGAGISVHPEYRRLGLATEIFKARRPLLQKLGVPITGAWMTSIGSQKAARLAGYEEVTSITYEELGTLSGIKFTDVPEKAVLAIMRI